MNNKGFTLVEVLAVIALIAIVGLIAIPNVISTLGTSKKASDIATYENIKTALKTMYEEKYYTGTKFYKYNNEGKDTTSELQISSNKLETNIQTLVSNGFLSGVNNKEECITASIGCDINNRNKKVLFNSDGEDLGECEVSITMKKSANGNVCYEVSGSGIGVCPDINDFGGDNQCS